MPRPIKGPRCSVTKCPGRIVERGCCPDHLAELEATGSPLPADHPRNLCKLEDCWGDVKGRGLCTRHLQREMRHGDPEVNLRPKAPACKVEDCEERNWSLGYCQHHYAKWRRHGDPLWEPPRYCQLCPRKLHAKGLCHRHYWRWWKWGDPFFDGRTYVECRVDGCYKTRTAKGLCSAHRTRELRHGDPLGGEPAPTGIDLPVEPLVRLISATGSLLSLLHRRGIEDQTEIDKIEMRYERAKSRGVIDLLYADHFACTLLRLHPALVWGDLYWQLDDERPTTPEQPEELMAA